MFKLCSSYEINYANWQNNERFKERIYALELSEKV